MAEGGGLGLGLGLGMGIGLGGVGGLLGQEMDGPGRESRQGGSREREEKDS